VRSKTFLALLLVGGAVFAGCTGNDSKVALKKSVDTPSSTVAPETAPATVLSDSDVMALEAELSEIEDFLLEIESVDIDISELDEAFAV